MEEKGFTFIELLVVVGIIALLSGTGLSTFLNLKDRRVVNADARQVEQTLRLAQRRALAGEKPSQCDGFTLTGYKVRIDQDAVYLSAVCPGATTLETEILMGGSTLDTTANVITFPVVRGGGTAATIDICQTTGTATHYQIVVSSVGAIGATTLIASPCT